MAWNNADLDAVDRQLKKLDVEQMKLTGGGRYSTDSSRAGSEAGEIGELPVEQLIMEINANDDLSETKRAELISDIKVAELKSRLLQKTRSPMPCKVKRSRAEDMFLHLDI